MAKKITFYASSADHELIRQIQELRPHWTNVNFILREALYVLLQQLRQPVITLPAHDGSE